MIFENIDTNFIENRYIPYQYPFFVTKKNEGSNRILEFKSFYDFSTIYRREIKNTVVKYLKNHIVCFSKLGNYDLLRLSDFTVENFTNIHAPLYFWESHTAWIEFDNKMYLIKDSLKSDLVKKLPLDHKIRYKFTDGGIVTIKQIKPKVATIECYNPEENKIV